MRAASKLNLKDGENIKAGFLITQNKRKEDVPRILIQILFWFAFKYAFI